VPVAVHSLLECRRAMERQGRLFAYLGIRSYPRLACMLVRLVDGTDFRLSRSGGGSVPVAVHSLRECRRAMERRGRLFAYLGYPVSTRGLHACWCGWSTGPIFDCREAEVGVCPWPCTVCESVSERWSDEAGCLLTSGIRSYPRLACMFGGWSTGPIFRLSRSGGGVPVAVHRYRSYRGLHACWRVGRGTDFRLSRTEVGCARGRAQSARVSASDGATRQAVCLPRVSGHTEACMHVACGWSTGPIFDCRETEWRESSRWMPRRGCVCVYVCAR
jgi:hypothetical protein